MATAKKGKRKKVVKKVVKKVSPIDSLRSQIANLAVTTVDQAERISKLEDRVAGLEAAAPVEVVELGSARDDAVEARNDPQDPDHETDVMDDPHA